MGELSLKYPVIFGLAFAAITMLFGILYYSEVANNCVDCDRLKSNLWSIVGVAPVVAFVVTFFIVTWRDAVKEANKHG